MISKRDFIFPTFYYSVNKMNRINRTCIKSISLNVVFNDYSESD